MDIRRDPLFFRIKSMGAPHGETLGRIKPLSRRSASCSFNSFSSMKAILYGGIELGRVSGNTSMPKFISLSGVSLGDLQERLLGIQSLQGLTAEEALQLLNLLLKLDGTYNLWR